MELSRLSLLLVGCFLIREGAPTAQTTTTISRNSASPNKNTNSSLKAENGKNAKRTDLCEIDFDRVGPLPININLDPIMRISLPKDQTVLHIRGLYRDTYTRDNVTNEIKFKLEVPEIALKTKFNVTEGYLNATPFSNETFPFGNISGVINGGFILRGFRVLGALNISNGNVTKMARISKLRINIIRFDDFYMDLGPNVTFRKRVVNWEKMYNNFKDNFENDFSNHKVKIESLIVRGLNKIIGNYTLGELEQLYRAGCPFTTIFTAMIEPPVDTMADYAMPINMDELESPIKQGDFDGPKEDKHMMQS